ncbi:UNVERIFIED_CONTAM: hypothetical protein K2H54_048971 [Gekko kuhli]
MPGMLSVALMQQESAAMKWKVLMGSIGRMDRPFEITLLYSSCGRKSSGLLALGSLQLRNCFHDKDDPHLSEYDKGSIVPCPYGGCISHLQVCDFGSDCSINEGDGYICENLPEGAHCSFEEDTCGWTLEGNTNSFWSIKSFSKIHEDLNGDSVLHATEGHLLYLRADSDHTDASARAYSASLPASLTSGAYQVQFSVYIFGRYNGTISLSAPEEADDINASSLVWERKGSWSDHWFLITAEMPELQKRFHLQFLATWGWDSHADIAVDNITFGLDCFLDEEAPVVHWCFTACGASGPRGPTQAQCDSAYYNTNISVTVEKEGHLRGVQVWKVPASNRYTISAYGAAGGKGAKNHNKRSHGIFISANFQLEKDELLYILVGQQGEDACPRGNFLAEQICLGESSIIEEEYKKEKGLTDWAGGGGGGGGATYIFREHQEPAGVSSTGARTLHAIWKAICQYEI